MSMAEIASVSLKGNGKIYAHQPQDSNRFHPTQKPVDLYKWILTKYGKENDKILDTHLGSGSNRIACDIMGYDFVGFELDKNYYEAQEKRFKQHIAQLTMF